MSSFPIHPDITFFAETNFRNKKQLFGIRRKDRRRHMYMIGKTGMGKTELQKTMIMQDIHRGEGLAIVDPHGWVEEILDYIPNHRLNDVVYFNPADINFPVAFNVLENVKDEFKHLVSDGLMGVFTKIWANMWSARMEHILRNCILALLDSPGNTMLGIQRILVDKVYRKKIVDKVRDPMVKSFWIDEFANFNERFRTEAIAPIQNKVGQFLSSSIIRNIVGQPKSKLDIRTIMDEGKILILNLSKGRIGEDNSALLGAMMVTKIQLAAMSRVDIPEDQRRDFYLYVDEFQNFATESFADILAEARKFALNLIIAHQYIGQLIVESGSSKLRDAVFGNVGTIITFRVGANDAEELVKEYTPYFKEEDLVNLNIASIYLKLMIDGAASTPFSANSLWCPLVHDEEYNYRNAPKVLKVSRERYAQDKVSVEEKIMRWLDMGETFKKAAQEENITESEEAIYQPGFSLEKNIKNKPKNKKKNKIEGVCDSCGDPVKLAFTPDEFRNVFCKECLNKFKQGRIDVAKLPKRNLHLIEKDEVVNSDSGGGQFDGANRHTDQVISPMGSVGSETIENAGIDTNFGVVKNDIHEQQMVRSQPQIEQQFVVASSQQRVVQQQNHEQLSQQRSQISLGDIQNQQPIKFKDVNRRDGGQT